MRALGFAFALTCITASLASAFPGHPPAPGFEPRPEVMISRYAGELGIDAATVEQIRALGEQQRAEREVIAAELQKQKHALRTLLESERPNEAEAIALARKIGTLETDLSVARLSAMMRIHALLTPEQNAALREKMRGRFHARRELLDRALTACEAELAEHCDDASGPPGAPPLMCLMHKRRTQEIRLAPQCEQALRELPQPHVIHATAELVEDGPPQPDRGESFDVLVLPPSDAQEPE
jgi:Spy/CpxP family protein refolding chaperone